MTSVTSRTWRLRGNGPSIVWPNRRDPRLHTAAVIVSVHVIGITALGFRVSIPQILAAIVSAGAIEAVLTYRRTGNLVWPASGLLTGSGVALILRLTDMPRGDYWSWHGWHFFALVGGLSLITKYAIRFRGSHIFNPSNLGLVLAFLLLGASVIEPLDFWWAPMGPWMALAYLVIIGGGIAITKRLGLLEMALTFWVILVGGLGILAVSGHCMTVAWAIDPVCGGRFWVVVATSPEVLIFLFFMITDPKTIPRGRLARLIFAGSLGMLATLLIAPQTVEFGAKVALLGSLTIWSPISRGLDRLLPDRTSNRLGLVEMFERLGITSSRGTTVFTRGAAVGSVLAVVAVAIHAVGTTATVGPAPTVPLRPAVVGVSIDPGSLPPVGIDPEVRSIDADVDEEFASRLAITLAENLGVEAEAMRDGNESLLAAVVGGNRLEDMEGEIAAASATGHRTAHEFFFETLYLRVVEDRGRQLSAALAIDGTGTMETVVYDASGGRERSLSEFSSSFVMRQLGGDRWLLVDVVPR